MTFLLLLRVLLSFCLLSSVSTASDGRWDPSRIDFNQELFNFTKMDLSNKLSVEIHFIQASVYSRYCCVSHGNHRVDCGFKYSSYPYHLTLEDNIREYRNVGGEISTNFVITSPARNVFDGFIVLSNETLCTRRGMDRTWSSQFCHDVNMTEMGTHACISRTRSTSDCLFRLKEGQLYHAQVTYGNFKGTILSKNSSVQYSEQPHCISRYESTMDCFVHCDTHRICHLQWDIEKGWFHNQYITPPQRSFRPPSAVATSSESFVMFGVTSPEQTIFSVHYASNKFGPMYRLGPYSILESPECILITAKEVHCLALALDKTLLYFEYNGGLNTKWTRLGGPFSETPSCVVSSPNKISCFGRSTLSDMTIRLDFHYSKEHAG